MVCRVKSISGTGCFSVTARAMLRSIMSVYRRKASFEERMRRCNRQIGAQIAIGEEGDDSSNVLFWPKWIVGALSNGEGVAS